MVDLLEGCSSDKPAAQVFVQEDPVRVEGDMGTCLVHDAMPLNGEMYIQLDFTLEESFADEMEVRRVLTELSDQALRGNTLFGQLDY